MARALRRQEKETIFVHCLVSPSSSVYSWLKELEDTRQSRVGNFTPFILGVWDFLFLNRRYSQCYPNNWPPTVHWKWLLSPWHVPRVLSQALSPLNRRLVILQQAKQKAPASKIVASHSKSIHYLGLIGWLKLSVWRLNLMGLLLGADRAAADWAV